MSVLSDLLQDIADAIRVKTGGTDKLAPADFPEEILSIVMGSGGGGANTDVKYVTFKSHDGAVMLGKKAVATGDDCADPIEREIFSVPTRESDAQYDYTFSGWATEQGGGVSSSALKAVSADRTVYAAYTGVVRYYTITYYDTDGSTVLKTESLAYGATPSSDYVPTKDGYNFTGWTPALSTVTGTKIYTGNWAVKVGMDALTWGEIAEISESGMAASTFEVGDKKSITFTAPNGESYTTFAEIVAFNHDDLADGSGKAGITMRICRTAGTSTFGASSAKWGDSSLRTALNTTTLNSMDSELKNAIKEVTKEYHWKESALYDYSYTTACNSDNCKIWLFSIGEVGGCDMYLFDGEPYAEMNIHAVTFADHTCYFLRSGTQNQVRCISATDTNLNTKYNASAGVVFGFCI